MMKKIVSKKTATAKKYQSGGSVSSNVYGKYTGGVSAGKLKDDVSKFNSLSPDPKSKSGVPYKKELGPVKPIQKTFLRKGGKATMRKGGKAC